MIILSHRGYWQNPEEKNSMEAMKRSFSSGFGVETDIRDYDGELVISHDMPNKSAVKFDEFLKIYSQFGNDLYLALNIKSDGLQSKLKEALKKFQVKNYFVFDMSVPDGLGYLRHGLNVFTRQSEYEKNPSFYDEARGVWIDCFNSDWIDAKTVKHHLDQDKMVCIVSPELHRREHLEGWKKYKNLSKEKKVFLCTDFPKEAKDFFNS